MAVYPLIDGPCPYLDRLSEVMDGDICRMCKREVHDLTDMSDKDRRTFLRNCSGETCVSYRVSATTAAALTALAVAAAATPAAIAQERQITVQGSDDRVVVISAGRIAQVEDIAIAVVVLDEQEANGTSQALPAKQADPVTVPRVAPAKPVPR